MTNNNLLTQANQRGANLVNMKHEAGVMFGQCTDRVADIFGTMRREIPEVIPFCPEIERILLRADFAHHMLTQLTYHSNDSFNIYHFNTFVCEISA